MSKVYFVYILKCEDDSYYTGITSRLKERILEHQNGLNRNSYTFNRRPVELKYFCSFSDPKLAIAKEKQIKKWSKAKKEALIEINYSKLPELAKKKFDN